MSTSVPNRFNPTDNRSAAKVMENFDYVTGRLDLVEAWFTLVGACLVTAKGLAVGGNDTPTTGSHLEMGVLGGAGFVQPHNRDTGHHLPLHLVGNGIQAFIGDADELALSIDGTTKIVDFPFGLSSGGAGLGSAFDDRKKSIIATSESRSNAAYGKLTTPDQVSVTLASGGVLKVIFQAMWKESVLGAARAAIFIGANQLTIANTPGATTPQAQAARTAVGSSLAGVDIPLSSFGGGLLSGAPGPSDYTEVNTGQVVGVADDNPTGQDIRQDVGGVAYIAPPGGGACYIFGLAAGTYTVSIQFKASSGSVTAKNRRLWVAAEAY
jgi:hypothetical protein